VLLVKHPRCPFCHQEVVAVDPKRACEACMAWHHRDCWAEGGDRCGACGMTGEAPPPPTRDLRPHLEHGEPQSPLLRPTCCAQRPCPRHAVLTALLLTLGPEPLLRIAGRAGLALTPACSASVAREILRAFDLALPFALRCLTRAELEVACRQLGLSGSRATKEAFQGRILARAQLVRVVYALPQEALHAATERLGVTLTDGRWVERVRRDLLLAPTLDFRRLVEVLRRDDLVQVCRRLGVSPGGSKLELRERLLETALPAGHHGRQRS